MATLAFARSRVAMGFVLTVAAPLSRADVLVVDPHGGPGAALLQSALDASHSGDVVLVKAGDYSASSSLVLPPGKGVALVADGPGIVLPGFAATGTAAGDLVLVRGLQLVHAPGTDGATLAVGGHGVMWIEDCASTGQAAWLDAASTLHGPGAGLDITTTASVVAARSWFEGGHGMDETLLPSGEVLLAWQGGVGISMNANHAVVGLFDVTAHGGSGGDGMPSVATAQNGGPGLEGVGPRCVVLGGSLIGGDEGADNPATTLSGSGVYVFLVLLDLRGTTVLPGGINGDGTVAPAIWAVPAATELPAPPRFVALDSPVREFQDVGLHVNAQPGDAAWLFLSATPAGLWLPSKQGVFTLDPLHSVLPVFLGAVDAAGELELHSQLPALPPGTDSALLFAQLAVADAQGQVLLGTASSLVWISASF